MVQNVRFSRALTPVMWFSLSSPAPEVPRHIGGRDPDAVSGARYLFFGSIDPLSRANSPEAKPRRRVCSVMTRASANCSK
jgi:hypothetical protein